MKITDYSKIAATYDKNKLRHDIAIDEHIAWIGIDITPEMIAIVKQKEAENNGYVIGDLSFLDFYGEKTA